jgi:hypothetical protein
VVEASVVGDVWRDVEELRSLLGGPGLAPLAEALFVNDDGDWRLVVVMADVEAKGTRPIYAALDEVAQRKQADFSLLSHLVVLDPIDHDSQAVVSSPVVQSIPPKRLNFTIPSLAGYQGAVLRRDPRFERQRSGRRLEAEVSDALRELGVPVQSEFRLAIGWRADFAVSVGSDRSVLIELKVTDRRSVKTRIRDSAGMANVSERPVVLVMLSADQGGIDVEERYGAIPVFPVDWERQGIAGLSEALAKASRWITENLGA